MEEEKLVYKAFKEQHKDINNKNNWVGKTKEILDTNGFSYIFQNVTKTEKDNHRVKSDAKEIKLISNEIRKREEDVFVQKIFCHLEYKMLNGNGKLIFMQK